MLILADMKTSPRHRLLVCRSVDDQELQCKDAGHAWMRGRAWRLRVAPEAGRWLRSGWYEGAAWVPVRKGQSWGSRGKH